MPTVLFKQLAGAVVARIVQMDSASIAIDFESGSSLIVKRQGSGIAASLKQTSSAAVKSLPEGPRPTARQEEYLEFIRKFMHRYGVSPAESDIQRHFMVSAPSVNQMIRTLEQRGYIARGRDFTGQVIPRSIRVLIDGV